MTTLVVDRDPDPEPNGFKDSQRKSWHWETSFEIDHQIYHPIKLIGRGAYGIVCSFLNYQTQQKVAIKKIHNVFQNQLHALRTLRELTILTHIKHPNLISLKDVFIPIHNIKSDFHDVYFVYDLMDIDLRHIIKSSMPISEYHSKYFLFQLLCGLEHLHSADILHRDLKPENLLVNTNCDLKICDFGLSRTCRGNGQSMTEYVVARWYRAPELLLCCDNYGTSIDVWSVGCIFAEILGRETLFPGTDYLNQLNMIIDFLGSPCEEDIEFINIPRSRDYIKSLPFAKGVHFSCLYPHADPLAIDLLKRMLVFDPTKRITVKEALQHPYMYGLYDPESNPPAKVTVSLDIDDNLEEHMIREMMVNEMLHFHPELEA